MHYVYILRCNNGTFYTGITFDIDKRVKQHSLGIKSWLKPVHKPFKLVYFEELINQVQAAKREKEIKGWNGNKKELLINTFKKSLSGVIEGFTLK